jgi:hypothetical protein
MPCHHNGQKIVSKLASLSKKKMQRSFQTMSNTIEGIHDHTNMDSPNKTTYECKCL